jgi:hypothetical protein
MNQITPVAQEAPITFRRVKIQLYIDICNTRISYLLAVILLAMGNIKACFKFACNHVDLTGAFALIADDYYNVATAMVFWIHYFSIELGAFPMSNRNTIRGLR